MKTKYFVALCVGLLLIAGGVFFFLTRRPAQEEEAPVIVEDQIPTQSPDVLGLSLEARPDNTAVKFTIAKVDDIKSISYELNYTAKTDEGELIRTTTGSIDVKSTDKIVESNYIVLGTCSSGHCKYDKGVSDVKLIIKIVKRDGKIYQSSTSLLL
ncbi:MAG: hypothetical protein HYT11_02815 [Candidatus Levybacteria bacterium]|nr:hypothetical protein [Candidatus Levybacteria bacterium]